MKYYLKSCQDIQVKVRHTTYTSFVSPGAKFEFEIDLMDIEARGATSNTRYGVIAIDIFTEIVSVVPMNNKTPEEMMIGLKYIFTSMGKPKQLYSDEHNYKRSSKMNIFIHDNEIKSIQTTTHAHTVEKAIITCKMKLYRRLYSLKQDKTEWRKHIDSIVNKYNSTIHNTIQIEPNKAVKPESHLWVNWHLQNAAKNNRTYTEIKKGDMVRFKLKPSIGTKSHSPK